MSMSPQVRADMNEVTWIAVNCPLSSISNWSVSFLRKGPGMGEGCVDVVKSWTCCQCVYFQALIKQGTQLDIETYLRCGHYWSAEHIWLQIRAVVITLATR